MKDLPLVEPGHNFERDVLLRSWLAAMNDVPVPEDFDTVVDGAVHRVPLYRRPLPWILSAVVAVATLFFLSTPSPVVVIPREEPTVDLYDLPPAPVVEHPVRVDSTPTRKRARRVVAGY
jgi:hypothetical protein